MAPKFEEPDWLTDVICKQEETLDVARGEHHEALARAKGAEEKANRLTQITLALFALALGLAGFEISFLRDRVDVWIAVLLLAPSAGAIFCLVVSGVQALEIDRVAFYWPPLVADASEAPDVRRAYIEAELRASFLADWSARKKVKALLQARAWLSRGLICLFVAALVGLWMLADPVNERRPKPIPSSTADALTKG
ncbi:MAG TPA: hypothetical protein VIG64_03980 [Actinomycetota bacterium]